MSCFCCRNVKTLQFTVGSILVKSCYHKHSPRDLHSLHYAWRSCTTSSGDCFRSQCRITFRTAASSRCVFEKEFFDKLPSSYPELEHVAHHEETLRHVRTGGFGSVCVRSTSNKRSLGYAGCCIITANKPGSWVMTGLKQHRIIQSHELLNYDR